jgi:hypothetical protein
VLISILQNITDVKSSFSGTSSRSECSLSVPRIPLFGHLRGGKSSAAGGGMLAYLRRCVGNLGFLEWSSHVNRRILHQSCQFAQILVLFGSLVRIVHISRWNAMLWQYSLMC